MDRFPEEMTILPVEYNIAPNDIQDIQISEIPQINNPTLDPDLTFD